MINRERQDDVWVKKCSPEKPEPHSRGSFRFDPQRRSAALPLVRAATLPSPGPLRLATRAPFEAARPREEAALPSTQASHVGCRPAWNPEPIKYTNNFWITGSLDYWIRLMEKNCRWKVPSHHKNIRKKILDIHKKYWITRSLYYWIQNLSMYMVCYWKKNYQAPSKTQKVRKKTHESSFCSLGILSLVKFSTITVLCVRWWVGKGCHAHVNLPSVKL